MEQAKVDITKLEVGTFTTKDIKVAHEKSSLRDVHEIMENFKISHLPICNKQGKPIGVIASHNVRAFYLSSEFDSLTANKIMQTDFLSFSSSTLLSEVTQALLDGKQCAAVIRSNLNDKLEIFTVSDSLKALNHVFQSIG